MSLNTPKKIDAYFVWPEKKLQVRLKPKQSSQYEEKKWCQFGWLKSTNQSAKTNLELKNIQDSISG